ncbi:YDG/SRA domain-containing protein [Thermodesulfobacteriota bacterium]
MSGEIEGIKEGSIFASRQELHNAGIHRGLMRGIAPEGHSIVLSGGYIDDVDDGDVIIYTGEGGRDQKSGRQVADQTLTGGNLALANNFKNGIPIRVNRGYNLDSKYAPKSGYRYDGLYRIEKVWHDTGKDGFLVWRYRLTKLTDSEIIPVDDEEVLAPEGKTSPRRSKVYSTRVIRSSEVGNYIKEMYDYTCQISGVRLDTPIGPYAEACHIQPVGKPHNGPDVPDNVLCLSPNMHVLFDYGAIALTDDLKILGMDVEISVDPRHHLRIDCMEYHRNHIYKSNLM